MPRIFASFGIAALLLLPSSGEAATGALCGIQIGDYSGGYESDMDKAVGNSSTLVVSISKSGIEITFGNAKTAIGLRSERLKCIGGAIRFDFEDNWGNKGSAKITPRKRTIAVRVALSIPAADTGFRDTTSLYPSAPVVALPENQ